MSTPRPISLNLGGSSESANIDPSQLPAPLVEPLRELMEGKHLELPIMPMSVSRVILECGAACPDLDRLTTQIESDPSLTAHILQMANSAGLAPQCAVEDIGQAARRLGTRAIGDLAVGNLLQTFAMKSDHRRTLELYRHASAAGIFSYKLGRMLGPARRASLLPGLLNDIGRSIVISFLGDLSGIVPGGLDQEVIEYLAEDLHEVVGVQLVRSWRLPGHLEVPIRFHARPEAAEDVVDLRDAHIAELANLLASWTLEPAATSGVVLEQHPAVLALSLNKGQLSELLSVVGEAREAAATFG